MKIREFENNRIGDEMHLEEYYLMAEDEESAVGEEPKDGEEETAAEGSDPEVVAEESEQPAEDGEAEDSKESAAPEPVEGESVKKETPEVSEETDQDKVEADESAKDATSEEKAETVSETDDTPVEGAKVEEAVVEEPEDSSQEAAPESNEQTEEETSEESPVEDAGPPLSPEEAAVLAQQTNTVQATYADMRKDLPDFQSGDTVAVGYRVVEAGKSRIQLFEGVVIKISSGHGLDKTFTVRKISSGVGVERIFPLHSPNIDSVKVLKRGKVRRAKLYYLRDRVGKATRIKERTNL